MTFFDIISQISTPAIKEMAMVMLPIVPDYFWTCPASSSGKYHPEFDLGIGGTKHHSMMVALCVREMALAEGRTQEEIELLVFCALYHDCMKQGKGEGVGYTVFDHPTLAAALIIDTFPGNRIAYEAAKIIASHMGKWNISKDGSQKLPLPITGMQKLLSHADMIASRRWWKVEKGFFD